MLARIRKANENDKGFTLIELLVVVIIIGILSAIAIPTFLKQREKAWDKAVRADLRNNALKMEEALDDLGTYPAAPSGDYAFKASDNVSNTVVKTGGGTATGFCLEAESLKIKVGDPAANKKYNFQSVAGKVAEGACPTP